MCRWPEAVGPGVAVHARPESLKRGILTVRVDSAVWATELSAHEPVLLERLNAGLEEPVVTRLKFLAGTGWAGPRVSSETDPEASRPVWPNRRDLQSIELSAEEQTRVAGLAAAAGDDPELGRAGACWLASTLKARRWLSRPSDSKEKIETGNGPDTKPERG